MNRMQRDFKSGGDNSFPLVLENKPHNLEFTSRECQAASDLQPLLIGQKRGV